MNGTLSLEQIHTGDKSVCIYKKPLACFHIEVAANQLLYFEVVFQASTMGEILATMAIWSKNYQNCVHLKKIEFFSQIGI